MTAPTSGAGPLRHQRVPVDAIDPLPGNRPLDMDNVRRLMQSIERRGQLQNIGVVLRAERFLLCFGSHRLEAAKRLGHAEIDASVWPEGTPLETVQSCSMHENHVRKDESLAATLDRLQGLMKEHQCSFAEAGRLAMISKGTVSKANSALRRLSPEVMEFVRKHGVGIAIAYEIGRISADPETQMKWLTEHRAGRATREAIQAGGKPQRSRARAVSVEQTIDGITFRVSMPEGVSYERIGQATKALKALFAKQQKQGNPVDLLPRLMNQGG